jgi:hypothetical protein
LNTLSSLIYGEKEGFNHERIRNLEAAEMSLIVPILLFAGITIALGAKWQIKSKIVWIWISFIALLYGATVILLGLYVPNMSAYHIGLAGFLQSIIITVIALLASFFRDPERIPPQTNGNILSPADGEVVYVKKIKKRIPIFHQGEKFYSFVRTHEKRFYLIRRLSDRNRDELPECSCEPGPYLGKDLSIEQSPRAVSFLKADQVFA